MNVTGRRRSRAVAVLLAGIFAAGVAGAADLGRLLPGLDQESVVQRFERRAAQPAPNLLVVAVDDKTFADTGFHWPFPRRRHAQAIDRLRRDGARMIVYDVQFTEQTTARDDNALITAVGQGQQRRARHRRDERPGRQQCPRRRQVPAQHRRRGGREQPAGRPGGRAPARGVCARRPAHAGHGRGAAHGPPDQGLVVREGRRLDRLPRPAGDDRHRLVLGPAQGVVSIPRACADGSSWWAPASPTLQDVHPTPTSDTARCRAPRSRPTRSTPWCVACHCTGRRAGPAC